jgi:uncharacterized protein (TIGR00369 family)
VTSGVVPVEQAVQMSGLELMRGIASGRFPKPPICDALPFELVEVEPGIAVFVGRPHAGLYNPMGTVHGGYAMTLLDSCMGCAIHTTLRPGQVYATIETKVNLTRAITGTTGPLRAEGRVIHVGSRVATAEGRIVDEAGVLYAHGTSTCLVVSPPPGSPPGPSAR